MAPTAYTVSMLRMLAFLPHARKHTLRVGSSRGDTPDNTHPHPLTRRHIHTQMYPPALWGERCVCRYTEYLALSIQRKGITYYRRLPARRALIYCYPVRISCGKKRMPAAPSSNSLPGFHPLPFVDRCFTSGRLSSALITFPSGVRGSPLLPPSQCCDIKYDT